jgi:hypothetical protein
VGIKLPEENITNPTHDKKKSTVATGREQQGANDRHVIGSHVKNDIILVRLLW